MKQIVPLISSILCLMQGAAAQQSNRLPEYAYSLSEHGFVTLVFDTAYAGESGGTPHWSEAPYERVEDIRYAIDYLVTLPFVDEKRIGALGLSAGGGYVIATAPTERRIRAVAGVSTADIGAANRESWLRGRTVEEHNALPNNDKEVFVIEESSHRDF